MRNAFRTPESWPKSGTDPQTTSYFKHAQTYHYRQGDYERAIADYTKAIELNYDPLSQP